MCGQRLQRPEESCAVAKPEFKPKSAWLGAITWVRLFTFQRLHYVNCERVTAEMKRRVHTSYLSHCLGKSSLPYLSGSLRSWKDESLEQAIGLLPKLRESFGQKKRVRQQQIGSRMGKRDNQHGVLCFLDSLHPEITFIFLFSYLAMSASKYPLFVEASLNGILLTKERVLTNA